MKKIRNWAQYCRKSLENLKSSADSYSHDAGDSVSTFEPGIVESDEWRSTFSVQYPPFLPDNGFQMIRSFLMKAKACCEKKNYQLAVCNWNKALAVFASKDPGQFKFDKVCLQGHSDDFSDYRISCCSSQPDNSCDIDSEHETIHRVASIISASDADTASICSNSTSTAYSSSTASTKKASIDSQSLSESFAPTDINSFCLDTFSSYIPHAPTKDNSYDTCTLPLDSQLPDTFFSGIPNKQLSESEQENYEKFLDFARKHHLCKHFHRVLFSRILSKRAAAYNILRRYGDARQDASMAALFDPELPFAYIVWADALAGQNQYALAAMLYSHVVKLVPASSVPNMLAREEKCLLWQQNWDMGLEIFTAIPGRNYCLKSVSCPVQSFMYEFAWKMKNTAHFIIHKASMQALIVDPCWDVAGICRIAQANSWKLVGALITHSHVDHVGGTPPPPFDAYRIKVPGVACLAKRIGRTFRVYVPAKERAAILESNPCLEKANLITVGDGDVIQLPFDLAEPVSKRCSACEYDTDSLKNDSMSSLISESLIPGESSQKRLAISCLICFKEALKRRFESDAGEEPVVICTHQNEPLHACCPDAKNYDPRQALSKVADTTEGAATNRAVMKKEAAEAFLAEFCSLEASTQTPKLVSKPVVIQVMSTPGHTSGSTCYLVDKMLLFSGDTLFKGTMGRIDLPTGSAASMWDTLTKLKQLDEKIVVFPGHDYGGNFTTIGQEVRFGALRFNSKEEWVKSMTGG